MELRIQYRIEWDLKLATYIYIKELHTMVFLSGPGAPRWPFGAWDGFNHMTTAIEVLLLINSWDYCDKLYGNYDKPEE